MTMMSIYFDDFLVCCPALLTNHDTNLQYPPIMTVPLHPLLLLQIHDSKYKIQKLNIRFLKFHSVFHHRSQTVASVSIFKARSEP